MEKLLGILDRIMGKLYIPCAIPADKQAHALSGLILFMALWYPFGILSSIVVVYLAATAKEIYDLFHKDIHTSDYMDALATVFIPTVIFAVMQFPVY